MPGHTPAIAGVWATILLRLDADGAIDLSAIADQIAAYAAAGCDGVYSGGTAAEFHTLSGPDFRAVSSATAEAARAAGLPFQIGASHPLAPGSLERVAFAATLSPNAIQVTLPDWTPIDFATARRFLERAAELATPVPLVLYNPPHAKTVLAPDALRTLAEDLPGLIGLKCGGGDASWYRAMAPVLRRWSVFIPGHHYASGTIAGAHGAYSNMACLSPGAAVRWAAQTQRDLGAALALEARIAAFMDEAIVPILADGHPGFAIDKALATAGGWADITPRLLWPYTPVSDERIPAIRAAAQRHIPEFVERSVTDSTTENFIRAK